MDKELLFKPRLPEADVNVPGVGRIRVRGLSREEALIIRNTDDRLEGERKILAFALVDPVLTEAEVAKWQQASAAMEIEAVTDKISELSGMSSGAAKEAYQEFEADPGSEFRLLPSEGAEKNGSPDAPGNEQ